MFCANFLLGEEQPASIVTSQQSDMLKPLQSDVAVVSNQSFSNTINVRVNFAAYACTYAYLCFSYSLWHLCQCVRRHLNYLIVYLEMALELLIAF